LSRFIQAAYDGDVELLKKMLNREDPIHGYHHDINAHLDEHNALHAAAMNGQREAVEMLLQAEADPHVRQRVSGGRDPADGETARDLADKWGWDDVAAVLKGAEERTRKGVYLRYGPNNNAKLWPIDRPEGLDPAQEKRAKKAHKKLVRPLPEHKERKWYGDLVYGITHGWDSNGNVIKRPFQQALASEEEFSSSDVPRNAGLLFPGSDGAQYVKLMAKISNDQRLQDLFSSAEQILGYDLRQIESEISQSQLDDNQYSQPAAFLASCAAAQRLLQDKPEVIDKLGAVAGYGLGEYAALVRAGVFNFETGLRLVKERAAAMTQAAASSSQGMISVAGISKESLEQLCREAQDPSGNVCQISADLFSKGFVCSGSADSINLLKDLADKNGALQVKVQKTACAEHSALMTVATERMQAALDDAFPLMRSPRCDVYLSTLGSRLPAGASPERIMTVLRDHLTSPVMWHQTIKAMMAAGIEEFVDLSPMKHLTAMMKIIDSKTWQKMPRHSAI